MTQQFHSWVCISNPHKNIRLVSIYTQRWRQGLLYQQATWPSITERVDKYIVADLQGPTHTKGQKAKQDLHLTCWSHGGWRLFTEAGVEAPGTSSIILLHSGMELANAERPGVWLWDKGLKPWAVIEVALPSFCLTKCKLLIAFWGN